MRFVRTTDNSFPHKSLLIVFYPECLSMINDSFMKSSISSWSTIDIILLGRFIPVLAIYNNGYIVLLMSSYFYSFSIPDTLNSYFLPNTPKFSPFYDLTFTLYSTYSWSLVSLCIEVYENRIFVIDFDF